MSATQKAWIRLCLVSGAVILADQAAKYLIRVNLMRYDSIVVIPKLFNLTHVLNPGGAFGFFANGPPEIRKFVFLFLSSLVTLFVLWFYKRYAETYHFLSLGLALIFGGAVGNLIDRFIYGEVVDFLDFYLGAAHWPAFNIADSAISAGVGILIYHILRNRMPEI